MSIPSTWRSIVNFFKSLFGIGKGDKESSGSSGSSGGSGPKVTSVSVNKLMYINFQYTDISSWPLKHVAEKNKDLQGWITVNGKNVEKFWKDMHVQHLNNIYGHEYGVPGISKGSKVKIGLRSLDGDFEASPCEFVWPWKGT